jgi:ABC-type Co2+ transport system permease subunit
MSSAKFDTVEILIRIFKYLLEGLVVSTAAFMFPGKKKNMEEIVLIGFVAAATFSLLDLFAPSIGISARQGAGMGIGANLVGFPASQQLKMN